MTHGLDDALVEKVARAIAGVCFETGWDDLAEGTRACFFPYARAALEAAGVAELREEIERLRGALQSISDFSPDPRSAVAPHTQIAVFAMTRARVALTNQGKAQG